MGARTFDLVNDYRTPVPRQLAVGRVGRAVHRHGTPALQRTAPHLLRPVQPGGRAVLREGMLDGWEASMRHPSAIIDPNWCPISSAACSLSDRSNTSVGCGRFGDEIVLVPVFATA